MTEYQNKSFSVYSGTGESYRGNWDRIFKKTCPKCDATDCGWYEPGVMRCGEKTRIAEAMSET